jgi:hypothetical protein
MASWAEHATVATPAPARRPRPRAAPRPRPKPKPKPRARAARRPGLLGGVVWIVVLAGLLGGIVALNVAVLQLNQRLERAQDRAVELRAANLALSGQLSSAGSAPQVVSVASGRLGLVPASPDQTAYVDLGAAHRDK